MIENNYCVGIVAALFTSIFGYIGNWILDKQRREKEERNFLSSIKEELDDFKSNDLMIILDFFNFSQMNKTWENVWYMDVDRIHFYVYENNIDKISFVSNKQLVRDIISCYSSIYSLINKMYDIRKSVIEHHKLCFRNSETYTFFDKYKYWANSSVYKDYKDTLEKNNIEFIKKLIDKIDSVVERCG